MTDDVRGLAVQFYNQTWDLIDQTARTPDLDRQMLTFAMASRALWDSVGGDEQWITGDWQQPFRSGLFPAQEREQ